MHDPTKDTADLLKGLLISQLVLTRAVYGGQSAQPIIQKLHSSIADLPQSQISGSAGWVLRQLVEGLSAPDLDDWITDFLNDEPPLSDQEEML